jgi:hypothetical protein
MAHDEPAVADNSPGEFDQHNAPKTRARRKSANDSVLNHGPKIMVPAPQSARKPERPVQVPLQECQTIQGTALSNTNTESLSKNDTSVNEDEEIMYDVVPLVVSQDDDYDNTAIGSNNNNHGHRNSSNHSTLSANDGAPTTSFVTTTSTTLTTKFQPHPTMTRIDENGNDTELQSPTPIFTVLPSMDDLHTKMHQLYVATTPNPIMDWNDLIFHRVRVADLL